MATASRARMAAAIGVSTTGGHTHANRTPLPRFSYASTSMNATTACFDAEYAPRCGLGSHPDERRETSTTSPRRRSSIPGNTAFTMCAVPRKLTAIVRSISSTGCSASGAGKQMPAACTSRSIGPSADSTSFTTRSTASHVGDVAGPRAHGRRACRRSPRGRLVDVDGGDRGAGRGQATGRQLAHPAARARDQRDRRRRRHSSSGAWNCMRTWSMVLLKTARPGRPRAAQLLGDRVVAERQQRAVGRPRTPAGSIDHAVRRSTPSACEYASTLEPRAGIFEPRADRPARARTRRRDAACNGRQDRRGRGRCRRGTSGSPRCRGPLRA